MFISNNYQTFNTDKLDYCDYEGVIDDFESIEQCKLAWDESEKLGHRKEHFFCVAWGYEYFTKLFKNTQCFLFNRSLTLIFAFDLFWLRNLSRLNFSLAEFNADDFQLFWKLDISENNHKSLLSWRAGDEHPMEYKTNYAKGLIFDPNFEGRLIKSAQIRPDILIEA